ncbi:hypothetical protein ACFQ34_24895 [Pseudonocardia benzenivorans]|jgi:hypothetical protein|uniref:Uncharacterized protein n=2 Tax=Pseudonocardia TaxID=1847 RepID=F4CTI0_PSEUX|nr:hypothetical protein [Pseudonocardia dioxanivorans]AEA27405.1 hypothetical protein Psed_5271 [Pseudonocardia dioxanivorans CB1190]
MPQQYVYVTTHMHVEGPIPGPHSLLTLASAAHRADGSLIATFTTNVAELPGATIHPVALSSWRGRAEDWLATRRAPRPPAAATADYARWVDDLAAPAVFVADQDGQDHVYLYWYLQRFVGSWPFVAAGSRAAVPGMLPAAAVCPLRRCRPAAHQQVAA